MGCSQPFGSIEQRLSGIYLRWSTIDDVDLSLEQPSAGGWSRHSVREWPAFECLSGVIAVLH